MADASCSGPSPFKRLVDHQSRDVSHHQDRLVDRSAGQAHGVRFSPEALHFLAYTSKAKNKRSILLTPRPPGIPICSPPVSRPRQLRRLHGRHALRSPRNASRPSKPARRSRRRSPATSRSDPSPRTSKSITRSQYKQLGSRLQPLLQPTNATSSHSSSRANHADEPAAHADELPICIWPGFRRSHVWPSSRSRLHGQRPPGTRPSRL